MKAVVFDLFATLIEHGKINPIYEISKATALDYSCIRHTYLSQNYNNIKEFVDRAREIQIIYTSKKIMDKFTRESLIEQIKSINLDYKKVESIIEDNRKTFKLYPDVIPTLEKLKKLGVKIGLLTNTSSFYKKSFFDFGLDKYFDSYVFSCDVGIYKDDKKFYMMIIRKLGFNENEVSKRNNNIIMIGDDDWNDVFGCPTKAFMIDRRRNTNLELITIS